MDSKQIMEKAFEELKVEFENMENIIKYKYDYDEYTFRVFDDFSKACEMFSARYKILCN